MLHHSTVWEKLRAGRRAIDSLTIGPLMIEENGFRSLMARSSMNQFRRILDNLASDKSFLGATARLSYRLSLCHDRDACRSNFAKSRCRARAAGARGVGQIRRQIHLAGDAAVSAVQIAVPGLRAVFPDGRF